MTKILVTYATRAGSTAEVATAIADVLTDAGATVDVRPVKHMPTVSGYDAIVIGSAIRGGQWLPEAVDFVKANHATLSHIPTAYFLVSGMLHDDTPAMRQTVLAYLDPVRNLLEPVSIGLFAGRMAIEKLAFLDRTIVKLMKAEEGDWRDWTAIQGWAHALEPLLLKAQVAIV